MPMKTIVPKVAYEAIYKQNKIERVPLSVLARQYGVSPPRISQICKYVKEQLEKENNEPTQDQSN